MLSKQIFSKSETSTLKEHLELTEEFCRLLSDHENISAVGLSAQQRVMVECAFNAMPVETRARKLDNFAAYLALCRELVAKGQSLREKRNCLKAFLLKYSLSIPDHDDVLATIDKDTYIEVYDNLFTQVYRSADFFCVTGHSVMALEFCEWFDLFQRSKDLTKDQVEVVSKIFSGSIKVPIFKPIEDHSVKEINSDKPRNSVAEIVLYSPVFGADGEFHGILHIFKVIESKSLEFHLV